MDIGGYSKIENSNLYTLGYLVINWDLIDETIQ